EQTWVDGVAYGADTHDAVPGFKMAPRIPGDGRDAVAELDALAVQPLSDPQRAGADFGVIGAMNWPFDRPSHDFFVAVNRCCVIDNSMTQQGPILHQSEHPVFPPQQNFLYLSGDRLLPEGICMNFSADEAGRKWSSSWHARGMMSVIQ